MVDYIADRMPLPPAPTGKGADIHSIRALGSSFYEVDGVNEILRADVMGHARTGANAKHYSKRIQTEGLDVILREWGRSWSVTCPSLPAISRRRPSGCCRWTSDPASDRRVFDNSVRTQE